MKKLTIKQEFEVALDTLLKAREDRYKHLDKFPELKNVHLIREEREGSMLRQEREIVLTDSLPAVITPFLKSGGISLIEKSDFDENENIHTFTVTPGAGLDQFFRIKGKSRYFSLDNNRSGRDYEIEIESSAFLVGGVIETAIGEVYNHNLEKDKKSILDYMKFLNNRKEDNNA